MKYLSDVGINKAPENGDLDVDGDIYSNGSLISNTYSSSEVRVGTWIDGRPIFQRTWTGEITGAANERVLTTIASISGLIHIIGASGYWYIGSGSISNMIGAYDASVRASSIARGSNGADINLITQSNISRTGGSDSSYAVTVSYIKS